MIRILMVCSLLVAAAPAFARGHPPGSLDEFFAYYYANRKVEYVREKITGVGCREIAHTRHLVDLIMRKDVDRWRAIRMTNRKFRSAGCRYFTKAEMTVMYDFFEFTIDAEAGPLRFHRMFVYRGTQLYVIPLILNENTFEERGF